MKEDLLISLFCLVDDFCKEFDPVWSSHLLASPSSKRDSRSKRSPGLSTSEIMTIVISFHLSKMRTFKDYYLQLVVDRIQIYFPQAPRYSRFVSLMKRVLFPLVVFLQSILGAVPGFRSSIPLF